MFVASGHPTVLSLVDGNLMDKAARTMQFQTPSAFDFQRAPSNLNPPLNPDLLCHSSWVPG